MLRHAIGVDRAFRLKMRLIRFFTRAASNASKLPRATPSIMPVAPALCEPTCIDSPATTVSASAL